MCFSWRDKGLNIINMHDAAMKILESKVVNSVFSTSEMEVMHTLHKNLNTNYKPRNPVKFRNYIVAIKLIYPTIFIAGSSGSGLRRRSAVARLLRSWVRIPPVSWKSVCCKCCVLSGRGLCDELIIRPEKPYRLWCVVVCDLETL